MTSALNSDSEEENGEHSIILLIKNYGNRCRTDRYKDCVSDIRHDNNAYRTQFLYC